MQVCTTIIHDSPLGTPASTVVSIVALGVPVHELSTLAIETLYSVFGINPVKL